MMKQLAAVTIATLIAAPAWTAEKNSAPKEEKIGIGSGAAIGAMAGGPVGLVLGAAFGGWLGDKFHSERAERQDYAQRYANANAAVQSLEALLRGSERELSSLRTELSAEQRNFRDALEEALEVEVYFRTAQSTLDQVVEQRLTQIVGLINEIDDFTMVVEGHSDSRGDAEYNDQLSAERAAAVRDVLLRAGISPTRITTRAAGETGSRAAENDLDALALERRVNVTIVHPDSRNRVAQQ
jgi:outer membrane protein OmpA-like peptidoglycan-associated protein